MGTRTMSKPKELTVKIKTRDGIIVEAVIISGKGREYFEGGTFLMLKNRIEEIAKA